MSTAALRAHGAQTLELTHTCPVKVVRGAQGHQVALPALQVTNGVALTRTGPQVKIPESEQL